MEPDTVAMYYTPTLYKGRKQIAFTTDVPIFETDPKYAIDSAAIKTLNRFYASDTSKLVHWSDTLAITGAGIASRGDIVGLATIAQLVDSCTDIKEKALENISIDISDERLVLNRNKISGGSPISDLIQRSTDTHDGLMTKDQFLKLRDSIPELIINTSTTGYILKNKNDTIKNSVVFEDASGYLGIGTTVPETFLHISSGSSTIAPLTLSRISNTISAGATIISQRARAGNTVVQNGDRIANWTFNGYDGAAYRNAAQIRSEIDGSTISSTSMPGRLCFFTTPTGSVTLAERMRIDNSGNIGIGSTAPLSKFAVVGSVATNNNMFNYVNSDVNKNRTAIIPATDTSSFSLNYSTTGSPILSLRGKTGNSLFYVDSLGIAGVALSSHAHGNITNAGAIGSTTNLPIITTTSGVLTVGAFGTGATNFCAGNDARLSDARTPTTHAHGNINNAGKIGTTTGLPVITSTDGLLIAGSFGTTSGTFAQGNDSRFTLATASDAVKGGITVSTTDGGLVMSGTNLMQKDYTLTARTPIATDPIAFWDASAAAQGKTTFADIFTLGGWTTDTYGITRSGNVGIGVASATGVALDVFKTTSIAINGTSTDGIGIYGTSTDGIGIIGVSTNNLGGSFGGLGCRATKFYVSTLNTAPANAGDTGTAGEIRFTADYIFFCVATNTWKRTAITTW
jgi:hypothetical protein